jgi:hypothetical protein
VFDPPAPPPGSNVLPGSRTAGTSGKLIAPEPRISTVRRLSSNGLKA